MIIIIVKISIILIIIYVFIIIKIVIIIKIEKKNIYIIIIIIIINNFYLRLKIWKKYIIKKFKESEHKFYDVSEFKMICILIYVIYNM